MSVMWDSLRACGLRVAQRAVAPQPPSPSSIPCLSAPLHVEARPLADSESLMAYQ